MNLHDILEQSYKNKNVIILGRPASGKTWLSNALSPMYPHHHVIHTDDYKDFSEPVAIQALIEDAYHNKPYIIEGCTGYRLLWQGAVEKSYKPDIIIHCIISRGKQREIYLQERDASKIKHLKRFHDGCMKFLNSYLYSTPEAEQSPIYEFYNEY